MQFSIRLFLALAFALWVLPHLVEMMGGPDSLNPRNLLDRQDQLESDYNERENARSTNLLETLDEISMYDSGLKRCIKQELRGTGRKLKHANELSRLLCDGMGISSLSGIDQLPKLTSLSLRNNNISSVSALTGLSNLKSLDLDGNPEIRDFTDLSYLSSLEHISVANLSGTYCHEVEAVLQQAKDNKSGFGSGPSVKSAMRSIRCRGKDNFDVEALLDKRNRGEALTVEESRKLRDYQSDQRWR